MTKRFETAKAGTIEKWNHILWAIKMAEREADEECNFCEYYFNLLDPRYCRNCPAYDLCGCDLQLEIEDLLNTLITKVTEGISQLQKLEEKGG